MKSTSTINPTTLESKKDLFLKAHAININQRKVDAVLSFVSRYFELIV